MKKSLLSFSVAVFVLLAAGCLSLYAHKNADVDAQTQASVPNDTQTSVQKPASSTSTSKKSNKQTVLLNCDLHCQGCCDKIMKNIAFEKGVKDVSVDLPNQTVKIVFDEAKTDTTTLAKAIRKLGYDAKVIKFE